MWFWYILIVLPLLSLCNSFNLTSNFEKLSLSKHFMNDNHYLIWNKTHTTSDECESDLKEYNKALLKPEMWAWLMFDARTKIPSGILTGNLVDLGQFDQCINIESQITTNKIISGKYCLVSIPLAMSKTKKSTNSMIGFATVQAPEARMVNPNGTMSSMFATCLPNSCTNSDVQKLYSGIIIKPDVFDLLCQTKSTQPKLTGGDIATISFLSIVFFIMLVSTAYDMFVFYYNKKSPHSLLIAFSILSNGKKLIATTKSSSQISCLAGIRVISMMWVILGHRFSVDTSLPNRNYADLLEWFSDSKNMYVLGATVSVDTFFVIGGLLVSYSFMVAMAKGIKFNIITFYIHRYLRLTPILAVIILIYITILKHLGSGPLWYSSLSLFTSGCEQYWWTALLYVQNYVNPGNMCVAQTWYLSVDTQLFVLSPLLLVPLKKWPVIGLGATAFLLFATTLASFLVAWFDELYGSMVANTPETSVNYFNHYYFPTHTRAGPWLMGIMLGYYIYEMKQNHKKIPINKVLAFISWIIALVILFSCVYTGHNMIDKETYLYSRIANSFYVALLRPGWALAICWVIIACVAGYGGPINWVLSLPIFQVLSRLTYSMYLIHNAMQMIVSCQIRTSGVFSSLQTLYTFWGDFGFTLATSILFTLAFESPLIVIERIIFGNGKDTQVVENNKKVDNP